MTDQEPRSPSDREIGEDEQAAVAIANLTTAVSVALAGAGLLGPLTVMLDTFEHLNHAALPPGHLAELLQMTVDTHREQLAEAIAQARRADLDS